MKNIIAFGASTSSQSINRQFATYAASQLKGAAVTVLDLNDYEMPIYSMDRENNTGIPDKADGFIAAIAQTDAIVMSLAEHNGAYTAAFKNIMDWASRKEGKLWAQKPMFLLATSPGQRGGKSVHTLASNYLPHMGANIQAAFTLPRFYQHFDVETGITDTTLAATFDDTLKAFQTAVDAL